MERAALSPGSPQASSAQPDVAHEANSSGVSWAAVIGGAVVIAALSLILLALGTGVGLSSVSPWSNVGASALTIGTAAIVWLILMQIIASAMGGYLAGRLRTKWARIHTDEVFFRDTAHGFLAWSLAAVLTAAFLASAAASMVGGGAQVGASALSAASGQPDERSLTPNGYYVDSLFRSDRLNRDATDTSVREEAGRIFADAIRRKDEAPGADIVYLAQLVAARTGLSQPEAQKRVSDVVGQARQTLDVARKAAAHASLWTFVALLIGAFCASYAATIGGRQRDHVVSV
jgi:hypothetical protein